MPHESRQIVFQRNEFTNILSSSFRKLNICHLYRLPHVPAILELFHRLELLHFYVSDTKTRWGKR